MSGCLAVCAVRLTRVYRLILFRNLFALPDVENPDVLFELNNDPTICAILDAVREEKEEVQSAEDGSGLDSTVARMIGEYV